MDGTVYEEDRVFDGTFELLGRIKQNGGHYAFITNNSSMSVRDYMKKVSRLGIPADEGDFFTAAQAAAEELKNHYRGAKVYCQGTKSLVEELRNSGIDVTENAEPADVVLVGYDTELTMEKIRRTCELLSTGDPVYLATNPDLACPVSFGFLPDCGAICEMIRHATGKTPRFIGKPDPCMVNVLMKKHGCSESDTVVVGDRLYTDIAAGLNAHTAAVCVLTGEATADEITNGDIKPTYTFDGVKEIADILGGHLL